MYEPPQWCEMVTAIQFSRNMPQILADDNGDFHSLHYVWLQTPKTRSQLLADTGTWNIEWTVLMNKKTIVNLYLWSQLSNKVAPLSHCMIRFGWIIWSPIHWRMMLRFPNLAKQRPPDNGYGRSQRRHSSKAQPPQLQSTAATAAKLSRHSCKAQPPQPPQRQSTAATAARATPTPQIFGGGCFSHPNMAQNEPSRPPICPTKTLKWP